MTPLANEAAIPARRASRRKGFSKSAVKKEVIMKSVL
jgi:hypothetical protein